ncbi:hypothetical protein BJX61DRAFT_215788 [Aspergillus egyptiacus]|nr:hypothetical protein BJX61DRAFT_215788 [Aspergillus egyptiacus]
MVDLASRCHGFRIGRAILPHKPLRIPDLRISKPKRKKIASRAQICRDSSELPSCNPAEMEVDLVFENRAVSAALTRLDRLSPRRRGVVFLIVVMIVITSSASFPNIIPSKKSFSKEIPELHGIFTPRLLCTPPDPISNIQGRRVCDLPSIYLTLTLVSPSRHVPPSSWTQSPKCLLGFHPTYST